MDAEVYIEIVRGLGPLGVLVAVIVYLLVRERNHKKVGNPNGVIKALERLEAALHEHNQQSGERSIRMLERADNMAVGLAALLVRLNDLKDTCTSIIECVRRNPE